MGLNKNLRLLRTGLRLHWKRLLEYKINLIFDIVLRLADSLTFFAFWAIILGSANGFAGWDMNSFLLIFAFEAFFTMLVINFAYSCMYVYDRIHDARLDVILTKPAQPWFLAAINGIEPSISGFLTGGFAIAAAALAGISIPLEILALGLLMVCLGAVITSLFGLIMATLSFWLGRMDSLDNIFESFWYFGGKPASIFPIGLQVLTAFTFPFIFIQTIPTMAILGKITVVEMLYYLLAEIAVIVIMYVFFRMFWKKGLRKYESGGG